MPFDNKQNDEKWFDIMSDTLTSEYPALPLPLGGALGSFVPCNIPTPRGMGRRVAISDKIGVQQISMRGASQFVTGKNYWICDN